MRRVSALVATLLVAAALLVLVGVGTLLTPARRGGAPAPDRVAVQSSAAVCPDLVASASVTSTLSAAVAPLDALGETAGGASQEGAAGIAQVRPLDPEVTKPAVSISAPGLAAGISATGRTVGSMLVRGSGTLAPGLVADQLTRGTAGVWRGLAATPCAAPVSRAWFIGGGTGVGQRTQVFLANVDDQQAVVDLALFGANGPIETPAGRGIVVEARSQRVVELSSLAPAQRVVAIHVVSREGRVAPSVLDVDVDGLEPAGIEFLPQTVRARRVVVPIVFAGDGGRQLSLLAPGDDTEVHVQLLTPDGAFAPVDLDSIDLEAGKVARLDISKVTGGQPVGLVLRAAAPIVAGLSNVLPGAHREVLQVAGTPALTGPAVVSGITVAPVQTAIALAAPTGEGHVRVATYAATGTGPVPTPTVQDVTVPAGSRLAVPLTVPKGAPWAWAVVTPLPGSGPVHAIRVVTETTAVGPGATATPLTTQRAFVTIPSARYRVGAR